MYLRKIKLKNIRCFENAEIDFDLEGGRNRKWTVLLGDNGTGKSTLLKAIALLMSGSDGLFEVVKKPDAWIRTSASEGEIIGEIETQQGELRKISLKFVRGQSISDFVANSQETLEALNGALEHTSRNYPIFAYGSARRLGGNGLSESKSAFRQPRTRSIASLFDGNAELNPLENWAMRLDYRSEGLHMSTVREVLSDFLPELTFESIDKKQEKLMFQTPDGLIPLEQLSDGYQNVAAWVGDLLFQISEIFEDYSDPLSVRGLLVIDEVDLHLHPKWQRRLLEFLESRLPNMQLIVTTHSVVTAQQTPDKSLFYCIRRDNGTPQIEAFEGDPGTMLLNQLILTEAFGNVSDESLGMEDAKARYRTLKNKNEITEPEHKEMEQIQQKISTVSEDPRESITLNSRQKEIMMKLLRETGGDAA